MIWEKQLHLNRKRVKSNPYGSHFHYVQILCNAFCDFYQHMTRKKSITQHLTCLSKAKIVFIIRCFPKYLISQF